MDVPGGAGRRDQHQDPVPLLTALNLDLRNEYMLDCARGLRRWNAELEQAGVEQRLALPHEGFNRKVGCFAGHHVSPDGRAAGAGGVGSGRRRAGCRPPMTGPGWPG